MGTRLVPGKGVFMHLNGDVLGFLALTVGEVYDELCAEGTRDLNEALDQGKAEELFKEFKANLVDGYEGEGSPAWQYTADSFGRKLYKALTWKDAEYRVTVILTDRDELKIDVRQWYNPNSRGSQS